MDRDTSDVLLGYVILIFSLFLFLLVFFGYLFVITLVVQYINALLLESYIIWYFEIPITIVIGSIGLFYMSDFTKHPIDWYIFFCGIVIKIDVPDDFHQPKEIKEFYGTRKLWLNQNARGRWIRLDQKTYLFFYKTDAMAFKLMWT